MPGRRIPGPAPSRAPPRGNPEAVSVGHASPFSHARWKLLEVLAMFTLILGCSLALMIMPSGEKEDAAARKAIAKVLDDQVVAWNKGDLKAFMAGYWKSPDLTFYSGNT